jgi:hypothetical protein
MNNFFLVFIAILLVLSGSLLFFYNRDILSKGSGELIGGCVPVNLQVQNVTKNTFSVEWETMDKCLGFVKYGDSIDSIDYLAIDEENNFAMDKHSIDVKNLKPSSIYYFVVSSGGVEYGVKGAPVVVNTNAF